MWQPVLCETKRLAWPKLAIGNFLPSRQLRQLLTAICGAKKVISRLQNMAYENCTAWLTKQKDIIGNILQIFDWNPLSPHTVTTEELLRAKLSFTDDKSGRRQKLRVEKNICPTCISLSFRIYLSLVQNVFLSCSNFPFSMIHPIPSHPTSDNLCPHIQLFIREVSQCQDSDEDDGIAVDADLDLCNGDVDGDDNSSDGFVLSVDLSVGNHIV